MREVIALNLPAWAVANHGAAYWAAADSTRSRANARQAYVLEFALPKMLTIEMQRELAVRYAVEVSGLCEDGLTPHGSVPLLLGIHEGHGRNPHCHLMLSSSINDGIRRAPAAWFMRHNPKHLELGGAKRSRAMAKTGWLIRVRELWAAMANKALVVSGFAGSLDHRSNLVRGISSEPSIHLGPSAAHLLRQKRPAPRVDRYSKVQLQNAAAEALRDGLELCRRRLGDLEVQEADAERSRQACPSLRRRTSRLISPFRRR